jgi:hypothetical protein
MRILFLAAVVSAGHALAAPFAVQVGEAKIGLDAPPGFADTTGTGSPRLQELGEATTSASNRVLLFAISDADMRRFTLGDPLELRRYMVVVTPRAAERDALSESAFRQIAEQSLAAMGKAPAIADYAKYLDDQPSGAERLLAELRREPDAVSLLQGARIKKSIFERSKYLLSTTSIVLVRGKALTLSVFTHYDDPGDGEWLRVTTIRWIDELRRLNSR